VIRFLSGALLIVSFSVARSVSLQV